MMRKQKNNGRKTLQFRARRVNFLKNAVTTPGKKPEWLKSTKQPSWEFFTNPRCRHAQKLPRLDVSEIYLGTLSLELRCTEHCKALCSEKITTFTFRKNGVTVRCPHTSMMRAQTNHDQARTRLLTDHATVHCSQAVWDRAPFHSSRMQQDQFSPKCGR